MQGDSDSLDKNPAIKLLDFFDSLKGGDGDGDGDGDGCTVLETSETAGRSETVRGLNGVGPEWMGLWLRQWGFGGGRKTGERRRSLL